MDDCRQIENLIYTYADRIDAGDLEGVAELYRDAESVARADESRRAGYDEVPEIYQMCCRIYPATGTPMTKHITTNVIIELDASGQSAAARAYFTVMQATDKLPLQAIISGRYRDSFSKRGDQWQFSRREMHVDLLGDCSAHLLYDAGSLA